jgi:hypothetical protein
MANVRKKISELTALTSASLDTTIVGVDRGTTYKIELDTLAEAVTSRVNILDRSRLSSLESVTSSFETKGSGILSGSISYTSLTNIPQGIVSQSTNLSSLNSFTQSIDSRVDNLENATSSYLTSLDGAISASSQLTASYDERYVLSGSITQTTWDNIENKPNGIVSQSTDLSPLNTFTQSIDSRVDSLENSTGSYLTNLSGAISSSSQLTSSFDIRYTLSGSITETTWNNISGKPSGIVSQSTDLTSLNQFTQSIDGRVDSLENATSSFETKGNGIISGAAQITSLGYSKLVGGNTFYNEQTFLSNVNVEGNLSSSVIDNLNVATASLNLFTSSVDTRLDTLENSTGSYLTSLSGAISSSSQLTASYDTRYTLSGSVVSGTTPAGTISGSSQLTSSFDGRYTQTGSFNTLTASFNSFTASAQSVTTGSNSFNGTQTITGSLIITTGSFVASQIVANTASLYLTSGSNMYVQNNGVVEITGSLIVSGSAAFNVNVLSVNGRSGDEGGEINLAIPVTNTTLQNRVAVDIFQNRLRIFEGSADSKGVYIDLSKAPVGNSGEITYKASGIVDAGTFVQLDNIKATITTTGNRGLSLASVSGSFSAFITGTYTFYTGGVNGMGGSTTITTTPSTSVFAWSFGSQGDTITYIINDTTNSRVYRITTMIGGGYLANFISIERLH